MKQEREILSQERRHYWMCLSALGLSAALCFTAAPVSAEIPAENTVTQTNSIPVAPPGVEQPPFPHSAAVTGVAPESPFFFFRQLLKMDPQEAEEAIQKRPEKFQEIIRKKVEEYKQMPHQQREWKLQVLDLRWYLFCGLDLSEDKLDKYVESVPEDYREIIQARLKRWFSIPAEQRASILKNARMLPWKMDEHKQSPKKDGRKDGSPDGMRDGNRGYRPPMGEKPPGVDMPPPPREKRDGKDNPPSFGKQMPPPPINGDRRGDRKDNKFGKDPKKLQSDREKWMWGELNNFFRMSNEDRKKVYKALPEKDRDKIWKVMRMLEELPPVERQNSLKILVEISEMPAEKRSAYLLGAKRWKNLSPEERRFFRVLFVPQEQTPPEPEEKLKEETAK